jgi:hypothetical protein
MIESLRRASDQTPRQVFITEPVSNLLTLKLFSSRKIKKQKEKYWHEWDDRTFFEVLQEEFPSDKHRGENDYQTAMARFNDVRIDIDFNVANSELRYAEKIQRILHEIGGEENFSRSQRTEFVKTLVRNIGSGVEHRTNPEQLRELHNYLRAKKITRINKLLGYILRWIEPIRIMWNYSEKSGWFKDKRTPSKEGQASKLTEQPAKDRSLKNNKPRSERPSSATASGESKPDLRVKCRGCGRSGHKREACRANNHPNFNKTDCEWDDSDTMKAIKASGLKDRDGNPPVSASLQ